MSLTALGVSLDLKDASISLLLGSGLLYFIFRWVMEFAMMPRHNRRWPLARLDFQLVSVIARFAMLAISAAALNRSMRSVLAVVALLATQAFTVFVLATLLMFVLMPIRMRARMRANRPSAASASGEAITWAIFLALCLTVIANVAFGIATYQYESLRAALWPVPPDPVALAVFLVVLNLVFVSPWLLRPVLMRLFGQRPPYRTQRGTDGSVVVTFVDEKEEPLV